MLSDITLGQYFPGKSLLHKLDPRMKLILAALYMVAVFLAKNAFCHLFTTVATVVLILLSRISLRIVLRAVRPILYVLIFTMLLNLFFTSSNGGHLLLDFWIIHIYSEGVFRALFMALRVILLVMGVSVLLTYTTTPIALTDAIELLLAPLKKIRVPVHEFAMMMTITLRFIPTLVEETDKIIRAQKARGTDFESGNLIHRAKAMVPILIPLFVSAFRRADELATSMECRSYRGGEGRTRLRVLKFRVRDAFMLLAVVLLGAAIVFCNLRAPGYTM